MKNRRNIVIIILCCMTLIGLFTTFQQNAQENPKKEIVEPTIIQEGVMSDRQRRNSKLFNDLGSKKLNSVNRNIRIALTSPILDDTSEPTSYLTQENYLNKEICNSDAIFVGNVKNKSSQLSEDFGFVFTDYEFEVKITLKNDSSVNINPDDVVTITRPSGVVKLDNYLIETVDRAYKPLKVGEDYLLFLNYISGSDSFKATGYDSTYELSGDKVRKIKGQDVIYKNDGYEVDKLINKVGELSSKCSEEVK